MLLLLVMSGDSSLIIIICILALLSASLLLINNRLAVKKPDPAKLSPYECGFSVSGTARQKFDVSYFLVGILYLVFDCEILFVYPFAMALYSISYYGFWIFLIFGVLLTVGFLFELGYGALNYADKGKPSENPE
jgi:NADH-quinone oxidoreductase subunit A